MTLVLILISGLRHFGVGNDTYSYILEFQKYASSSFIDLTLNFWNDYFHPGEDGNGKDPGFAILCKCLTFVSTEPLFFEFVIASFLLIALGVFFDRYITSMKGLLLAYIYYITSYYIYLPNSSARQSLALGFLLIGYLLYQKKNGFFYYVLFCLFASFFHKSALVALVFLPVYYYIDTKLLFKSTIVLFGFMMIFYRSVGLYITSFSDVYSVYGSSDFYDRSSKPYMFLLLAGFVFMIAYLFLNKQKADFERKDAFVGLSLAFVFSPISLVDPSLMRILSYFGVWTCIALDSIAVNGKYNKSIDWYWIILIAFLLRALVNPGEYAFFWNTYALPLRY